MGDVKKIILILVLLVFSGCGGGSSSSNTTSVKSSNVSGLVQKGPFLQGSLVTAYKLNNGIRSNTEKKSTTTVDNKGSFSLVVPWSGPTEYEIKGQYLDENTGSYLNNGTLVAIVDIVNGSTQKVNINIFTHIAASHIKEMLKNNMNILEAKEESTQKIKEMFSLDLSGDTQLEELDLTDGIGSHKGDNTQLLKISAAVLNSNNSDDTLEKLTQLISVDGEVNNDVIDVYSDILEKADEVDLSNVHNILENKIGASNAPKDNTREGELPFKHSLVFDTKVDALINKGLISNYIVVNNLNGSAKLTILEGQYSLNDSGFTNVETRVNNGDRIKVKHYAVNKYSSEKTTTLKIGVSNITFKSITKSDPSLIITTPNQFSFPIAKNIQVGNVAVSKEILISGLSDGVLAKVGVTNGASYKINNGEWKSNTYDNELSFSSVVNGDVIKVSKTASSSNGAKSIATLTVGGVSADFIVFTRQKDIRPDLFSPKTLYEVELDTVYETKYFTTSGYEGGLDIKVTNGEVQLEGESVWLSRIPQVPIGYKVKFRQTSAKNYGSSNKTIIEFGKSVIDFETITKTDPSVISSIPKSIIFKTKFDEDIDSFVESEERIITGMNGTATYAYPSGGTQISINGQEWTIEPVSITLGTRVKLKMKTGLAYNKRNIRYIYYGPEKKLFARFDVFTKKKDIEIDDIDFSTKEDVKLDTYFESNIVTISGITSPSCANIINGEFKFNGNDWTSSTAKVCFQNGQTLQLRHKSSIEENTSIHTIVSFDTKQYEFKTTTSSSPQFLNKPRELINQNSNYEFTPKVRDNHTLTFSLSNKPTWMNINDQTGKITGIPSQSDIGQSDVITLLVKSSSGLEKSLDFKVTVNDINDVPVLSNTWNSQTIDEYSNYSKTASAIDIEGGELTWSLENNPSWLSIDSQTGKLSGSPRQTNVGLKEGVKVIVREEDGLSSSFTFNITVVDKNKNAIIYDISDKTVNENEELLINVNTLDLDGDTLTFEINNKPSWLSFDSSIKKLRGTPTSTDIGEYKNISISVTDGHGSKMWTYFDITVLNVNDAPTITSSDFKKEFILDDTNTIPNKYIFTFDIADNDNALSSSDVTYKGEVTETRVGFGKKIGLTGFGNSTVNCIRNKCTANISFGFQELDDFHPSLKTRHTFTVSDGDKSASNYIDIWYAPTKPVLSGDTSHTIEVKDKNSYEAFNFTPTNSGNKARTWSIKNKPLGFTFNTSTGEIKYSPINKGLLLNDTTFKGIEITASNDRGTSNKFIFNITVKGKPPAPKFEFVDKQGVEIQQWFDSSIIVDWLEVNEEVTISSSSYVGQSRHSGFNVNGQAGISGTTKVKNGDKVTVWHKSSNEYNTTLNTNITIGNDSDTFSTRTKTSENTKLPLITGAPNTRANVGELYTYTPSLSTDYTKFAPATKGFTIENKPSWAVFDNNTGKLSGKPTEVMTHNQVRITAFGDKGLDNITFNITVSNNPPYINGFGHTLDNPDLSFTFTDNENWRSKITEVSMYGCYDQSNAVVLNPTDYTFSEGSLKLHASTSSSAMLRTPFLGGAGLIIKSTDYPNNEASINMVEDGMYGIKATIIEFADNKPITENNLNEARINIFLSNHLKFKDNDLLKSNFSLSKAPRGVSISNVGYINDSVAQVTLSFDGTDFDENKDIQILVSANELNICQEVVSNSLNVTAIIEEPWSNLIYPSNPVVDGHFGTSVDIKNETVAVASKTGVYIFKKDGNGDYQEVQIIENRVQNELVSSSVALDGEYLVIGDDSYNGPNNSIKFTGATYIYKKDASGQYQFLSDITPNTLQEFDHFGASVDISGDLIIVGAYNADNHKGLVYLFKNDGNDNISLVEIISRANGKLMDQFGFDVAIDGDSFVIGSNVMPNLESNPVDSKLEIGSGFANYYNYLNDTLTLMKILRADDSSILGDNFGQSVAISGDHIAVGAPGNNTKGSVYIYKRAFDTATDNGKIEGEIESEYFGSSVDIYHNVTNAIAVGTAVYGNAYSVTQSGSSFTKYKSTLEGVRTAQGSDRLGYRVAIDANEVVFGALNNDDKGENAGAVLVTNVAESITSNTNDTTPHQFRFTDIANVSLDEVVSSTVIITGINQETNISILNGEYSLDNGVTWESEALTLQNNQVVKVRHTTSSIYATTKDTSLMVGGISDIFSSTTISEPLKTVPSITSAIGFSLENDEFNFSFTDNELWRSSISKVYYRSGMDGTYSLLNPSDYSITSGQIKLNVKNTSNVSLRTPFQSGGSIKILASTYEDNIHPIGIVSTGKNAIKVENSAHQDNNPINEGNLNDAKLYVILGNSLEFIDNILDIANFTLSVAPTGVSISSVEYNDSSSAIVILSYDGTDFDVNSQVNVIVNKNELNTNATVTAKYPITVKALDEQAGDNTSGQAIDPYIVGARFWYDLDNDLQKDSDELSTFTDEKGKFTFSIQVPENGLIKMLEKGLHNGKVFTGNLSSKYTSTKKGLISPITSISALGFTDSEIISLLVSNGFDSNLSAQELYLDPFNSEILLNNGDLSTANEQEKAKFRRVLLANVIINSATVANTLGYDISKSDLKDFFEAIYTVAGEGGDGFEGAPSDTTILKFLISLGNDVLSNANLITHSKIRARIFVSVAEYASKRVKETILSGSNLIWEFDNILLESKNMISPLTNAYIKSLINNINNPKIAWLEIDSVYRPMLMVNNSMLGSSKKIRILYKDSSNEEQGIEFIRDNHNFVENSISSGQWIIQDRKVLANGKEFEILGDKIIVNGEKYSIRDVIIQNEDDSLDNFYEELPTFVSSYPEDEAVYVNLDTQIRITYDKVPHGIHVESRVCYLNNKTDSINLAVTTRFSGATLIFYPTENLLHNKEYRFACSMSYGNETSSKSIKFNTKPKSLPLLRTGQSISYDEDGNEVLDNSLKDDGFYKKGSEISRINNANIVEDLTTGLMWNDNGNNDTKSIASSKLYCNAMDAGGYSDWRLATIKEMQTLLIFDGTSVDNINGFSNLTNSDYWTSTKTIDSSTWNSDEYIYIKFPDEVNSKNEAYNKKAMCVR